MKRRKFLSLSSLALAAGPLPAAETGGAQGPRLVFTKGLEKLPFPELAERVAALGVAGIEGPVRKGGHVEPEEAPDKLPLLAEALKQRGLELSILTSDIVAADRGAEALLRTAAALGIRRYRLGAYQYDLGKPIPPQLAEVRARLQDLAAMNRELGVQGQFQNHRGNRRVGAPVWDVLEALEGIESAALGLAYDFAHATVEGANAWELNFHRAAPHIVAVYFKDYRLQGRRWEACPLGGGIVNPEGGKLVKALLPAGTPVSLHVEYVPGGGERTAKTLAAMKADLATLDRWLS